MSAPSLDLDPKSTALVLVDLQNFTVALPTQPHSGGAVLDRAVKIADACRAAGVQVVLVRVESGPDNAVALRPRLDEPQPVWNLPPGAHDFPESLGPRDGDVVVTKYGWGGFYGTDLDVQLRRRGIKTLLMGGLVTGVGLDTTVRQAYERGYDQVILTDVCAGFTQAEHDYCLSSVFPRVARLRTAEQLVNAVEDA